MTLKTKSKVRGMRKKSKIELTYAIVTVDSESQVCVMHTKKSRVGLRCTLMTLQSDSKICGMRKRTEWSLNTQ